MSAFGKVSLSTSDVNAVETVVEEVETTSAVDMQVDKFDTSYSTEKLQELYAEYDKITIDEEKVKSLTQIKVNAVSQQISFRMILGISTTAIVTVLLAFLCIYNIFVINGMSSSIGYLQEEIVACEQSLYQAEVVYNQTTDISNLQEMLKESNFRPMNSSNVEAISIPEVQNVIELQGETNWFDSICNFLSQIFG